MCVLSLFLARAAKFVPFAVFLPALEPRGSSFLLLQAIMSKTLQLPFFPLRAGNVPDAARRLLDFGIHFFALARDRAQREHQRRQLGKTFGVLLLLVE